MASTSSPPSPFWKHDVFLSFRGTDTRNSFTSHLYHALQRNQIDAYIDNKLDGGEKLEPALLKRIEDSYISVVIFSENYADSTFCLRELSKIHECMETKGQKVLPVFHQLDPSQVQDLITGSYGAALSRHQKDCAPEEVESWRHASKEIANLKGWDSSVIKDETRLIEKIVSDIQKKLKNAPSASIDAEGLVGMQSRVKHIESLLSFGSTGVLIVGIWGMGGIGKSTTAKAVYKRNSHKFEGRCFFPNVRKETKKHGIDHVRQEILREVLENKDIHTTVLTPDIKRILQRKKVLIVLDDVKDPQHLKFLVGEDGLFGEGSRIIVTSRDRQVLINACQEENICEVTELDGDDALRLFSFHAFKQNNPPDDEFTRLSETVVRCVKGIPLVLKVLGASLYKRTSVEYWKSKVAQLGKNGGGDIKKCLKMCYDELDRTEKKIFLDIACFFGRCKRDYLQRTLDLEERSGIDHLIDMCLIKIVENEIWMHDVLLKLGRDIVVHENVDPRKRSRLWDAKDVYRVLREQGTGKVESIYLDLSENKEIDLSPAAFEGMYNLRLLKFYYPPFLKTLSREQQLIRGERVRIHLPQGLHFLSNELRILDWSYYPLKSLPSNFFPENLAVLEMTYSELEQLWNEYQPLENLKIMNLRSSSKLILSDFHFSNLPNLEVPNLDQLVELNLSFCTSLTCLPDSIGELISLKKLDLQYCKKLASLPSSIGQLKCLVKLTLDECSLASLPESIGELKSLVELDLSSCKKLASLPSSIGGLKSLVKLEVYGCSELASLPESIGELKSLVELDLSSCKKLASLPSSIGGLKSLVKLEVYGCLELASLPESIGELKCLETLDLSYCSKLASLPNSIYGLESLEWLSLHHSDMLKRFPILNPRRSEEEEIATTTNKLGCLRILIMNSCGVLEIPGSIGSWVSLTTLKLYCSDLERIPASIKQLPVLTELNLSGCERLQHLPQLPSSLQVLDATDCISLTSVGGIFMQGYNDYEAASQEFNFSDCLQLDQNSLTKIIGDARLRIERMATSLFNQQYFGKPISVRLCIPGSEVPEWFTYKNTGGPTAHWHRANTNDQLFGFTLCAVVSFGPCHLFYGFDIKCECHLITKDGTHSDLSFNYNQRWGSWKREHVFIWSIHSDLFFKEASFDFKPLIFLEDDDVDEEGNTDAPKWMKNADMVVQSGVQPLFVEDCIDELKLMGNA